MIPVTALDQFYGLLDLMLTGEEHDSPDFNIKGIECSIARIDDHGVFEAVCPEFGFSVIFAGWYRDYVSMPVHISITGDYQKCLQWLPTDPADKRSIIERLPFDQIDKTTLTLAV